MNNIAEDKVLLFLSRYRSVIISMLLLGVVSGGLWWAYQARKSYVNRKAGLAFAELLKISSKEDKRETQLSLSELEDFFNKTKVCSIISSKIAAFVLAKKADLFLEQDNFEQAVTELTEAIKLMPDGDVKELFMIKKARVMLLSQEQDLIEKGLAELEKISLTGKEVAQKLALYFLHLFYWENRAFDPEFLKTQDLGQQFLDKLDKDNSESSFSQATEFEKNVRFRMGLLS